MLVGNDLFQNNNVVVLLVRDAGKVAEKYGDLINRNDVRLIVQDICQPISENNQRFDYIVHAASAADAKHFDSNPIEVFDSNVIGIENVVQLLRQHLCEAAVYLSSFTVYGSNTESVREVNEDFCGVERWDTNRACYSYGKRSAEFICMAAVHKYGVPIRIVRPGFVYGASGKDDSRVYAEVIRNAANDKEIILRSTGYIYRSMIYVTDLVRGIFCVLFKGTNGEAYNIANEHISIREFAEIAVKVADSANVGLRFENLADEKTKAPECIMGRMSCKKLSECGWKPKISVENGIGTALSIERKRI